MLWPPCPHQHQVSQPLQDPHRKDNFFTSMLCIHIACSLGPRLLLKEIIENSNFTQQMVTVNHALWV